MEWDRNEFRRAVQRGVPLAWDIFESYVQQPQSVGSMQGEMALFAEGRPIRRYAPSVHPELVTSFAKLAKGDSPATMQWMERWGLLGFQQLNPMSEPGVQGDPLRWIWVHARTVDLCLRIEHFLNKGDTEELTALLGSSGRQLYKPGEIPPSPLFEHGLRGSLDFNVWSPLGVLARGDASTISDLAEDANTISNLAWRMQRDLVNWNIAGIGFRLTERAQANSIEAHCSALIEVIYWHLAQNIGKGTIRRCAKVRCGKPFLATRDNQRYCPPQWPQTQSPCAAGERMARMRQGKRATGVRRPLA